MEEIYATSNVYAFLVKSQITQTSQDIAPCHTRFILKINFNFINKISYLWQRLSTHTFIFYCTIYWQFPTRLCNLNLERSTDNVEFRLNHLAIRF